MLDTVDASSMLYRLEMEGEIQDNMGNSQVALVVELLSVLWRIRGEYKGLEQWRLSHIKCLGLIRV